jgi:hypothetical protein
MSGITRTIPGFAFAAALALVLPTQALSQEAPKAGVVTTLQGTALVARSTQEPRRLKFRDDVSSRTASPRATSRPDSCSGHAHWVALLPSIPPGRWMPHAASLASTVLR